MQLFLFLFPFALAYRSSHKSRRSLRSLQATAADDLETICATIAVEFTRDLNDETLYSCDCIRGGNRIVAQCSNNEQECYTWSGDSTQYTLRTRVMEEYTIEEENNQFVASEIYQECLLFEDTCNEVCVGAEEDLGVIVDYATLNNERCNSFTGITCDNGNDGYILDCTNLVAGSVNTCTSQGIALTPWRLFFQRATENALGYCPFQNIPASVATPASDSCEPLAPLENPQTLAVACERVSQDNTVFFNDTTIYTCECDGTVEEFIATCTNGLEECRYNDVNQFTTRTTLAERYRNLQYVNDVESCLYFNETCQKICLGEDGIKVNDQKCTRGVIGEDNECIEMDCANVGLETINTCTGESSQGAALDVLVGGYAYAIGACEESMLPGALGMNQCGGGGVITDDGADAEDPGSDEETNDNSEGDNTEENTDGEGMNEEPTNGDRGGVETPSTSGSIVSRAFGILLSVFILAY